MQCGTVMLETFQCSELHLHQQQLLWFQQDGATAHTAEISTQVFRTMLPGRVIFRLGDITWPACSPDHAVPDYFLWGHDTIRPANIVELK